MILLIWVGADPWAGAYSFGEGGLKFYEMPEDSSEAELARQCHGHCVNQTGDDAGTEKALDQLSDWLYEKGSVLGLDLSRGDFGPYSAIYVSGFLP